LKTSDLHARDPGYLFKISIDEFRLVLIYFMYFVSMLRILHLAMLTHFCIWIKVFCVRKTNPNIRT